MNPAQEEEPREKDFFQNGFEQFRKGNLEVRPCNHTCNIIDPCPKLKNEKFADVCMTGGMTYTPSHTNVCKFVKFHLPFPKLI